MPNPVELISTARRRLATVASVHAAIYPACPAIVAFALALALAPANVWISRAYGYEIAPDILSILRQGLAIVGSFGVLLAVALAVRGWRRANDFLFAAERLDAAVNARQEILTFAALTDPSRPSAESERLALFPVLRKRAADYLAGFVPNRTFRFEFGRPIRWGSAISLAILILLGLSMMALMRPPSPEMVEAHKLREMARAIERSSAGDEGRALAKALRDTASAFENPKLPPEQKLKLLAEVEKNLEHQNPPVKPPQSAKGKSQSGKGTSAGKGDSGSGGEGSGAGQGSGSGQGVGKDKNAQAKGSGAGKGDNQQFAQLRKELSTAKQQMESESGPKNNSLRKPAPGQQQGSALTAGANPNQPSGEPDSSSARKSEQASKNAAAGDKSGEGGKQNANNDKGSPSGDTRLGQFPEPVRYERFYKAGEHGPPVEIRDARYVVFRLPEANRFGGGKTVLDTEKSAASTPYSNAPLGAERNQAAPDERQLVPPRYRELIQ